MTIVRKHVTRLGSIWSHWTVATDGLGSSPDVGRGSDSGNHFPDIQLYRIALSETSSDATNGNGSPVTDAAAIASIDQFDRRLVDYCETGDGTFRDIPIDASGWTDFSRRVYQRCREIEPGETLTYKELARRAGNELASRAVGAAMARNRVLLVIPCHRVIASNGQLRGFSAPGGLATKQTLLDLEQSRCNPVLFAK